MSGAIPLLPLWAFGNCYKANFTFLNPDFSLCQCIEVQNCGQTFRVKLNIHYLTFVETQFHIAN
jgi:hypothetical protein